MSHAVSSRLNDNPLIVQSDLTVLVDVSSPRYAEARDALARFAELVKSPEHIHTYRVSPLSIWNACAAGVAIGDIVGALDEYARFPIPTHVATQVRDFAQRFGRVRIERDEQDPAAEYLLVRTNDAVLAEELAHGKQLALTEDCTVRGERIVDRRVVSGQVRRRFMPLRRREPSRRCPR